jgi:hypothetical protein
MLHSVQVDCAVGEWSGWSECDAATGRKDRTRHIVTRPSSKGSACGPALSETTDCVVACALRAWAPWGECSGSCGGGQRTRRRVVEFPAKHGGAKCGSTEEADACNAAACAKRVRRHHFGTDLSATGCVRATFSRHGSECSCICWQAFRFKVDDDVVDQDGERCRVVRVDTEDFEKPYELEYPNGSKFWAAESAIRRHKVRLSGRRWMHALIDAERACRPRRRAPRRQSITYPNRSKFARQRCGCPALRCAARFGSAAALCLLRRAARAALACVSYGI